MLQRKLATVSEKDGNITRFIFELLNAVTKVHLVHLKVSGPGSFAAHTAMNDFYDQIGGLADSIAEQWQGITESLLDFPTSVDLPSLKNADQCIQYLRGLYDQCNSIQKTCPYSEIVNTIDEIKSLINSTKYKLIFLK